MVWRSQDVQWQAVAVVGGVDVVGQGRMRWGSSAWGSPPDSQNAKQLRLQPELFRATHVPQRVTQARVGTLQRLETDRNTTVGYGKPIDRAVRRRTAARVLRDYCTGTAMTLGRGCKGRFV